MPLCPSVYKTHLPTVVPARPVTNIQKLGKNLIKKKACDCKTKNQNGSKPVKTVGEGEANCLSKYCSLF